MKVVSVCISEKKGTRKHKVAFVEIKKDHGIIGDAHAGNWHRQISLLGQESLNKMKDKMPDLDSGDFAENIMTEGLTLYELPIGTRLKVGETELEVTQIGKECHQGCEIRKLTGDCVMPREGIFAIVIKEGKIYPEDPIEILS
ncbi:MAG: MOSC domain-containing protein [Bacillota bacterium]|nr:MOSC domain-containing protein [Bacillota bacterium]